MKDPFEQVLDQANARIKAIRDADPLTAAVLEFMSGLLQGLRDRGRERSQVHASETVTLMDRVAQLNAELAEAREHTRGLRLQVLERGRHAAVWISGDPESVADVQDTETAWRAIDAVIEAGQQSHNELQNLRQSPEPNP